MSIDVAWKIREMRREADVFERSPLVGAHVMTLGAAPFGRKGVYELGSARQYLMRLK